MAILSYRIGALKETPELRDELKGRDVVIWRKATEDRESGYYTGMEGYSGNAPNSLKPSEITIGDYPFIVGSGFTNFLYEGVL